MNDIIEIGEENSMDKVTVFGKRKLDVETLDVSTCIRRYLMLIILSR